MQATAKASSVAPRMQLLSLTCMVISVVASPRIEMSRQRSSRLAAFGFYSPPFSRKKSRLDRKGTYSGISSNLGLALPGLSERMCEVQAKMLDEQISRPPNEKLLPTEFVAAVLKALWMTDEPLPDSGCRVLFRSSTEDWKNEMRHSVGAPRHATEDQIASALNRALSRPRNQFGILVGVPDEQRAQASGSSENSVDEASQEPLYVVHFPSEIVDFGDGSCWVECQFRHPATDRLLVITGWGLMRRRHDAAWLIHTLDWQDFRDEYRPGVGREEWIRVFG